jgi:hypothetical protein
MVNPREVERRRDVPQMLDSEQQTALLFFAQALA